MIIASGQHARPNIKFPSVSPAVCSQKVSGRLFCQTTTRTRWFCFLPEVASGYYSKVAAGAVTLPSSSSPLVFWVTSNNRQPAENLTRKINNSSTQGNSPQAQCSLLISISSPHPQPQKCLPLFLWTQRVIVLLFLLTIGTNLLSKNVSTFFGTGRTRGRLQRCRRTKALRSLGEFLGRMVLKPQCRP